MAFGKITVFEAPSQIKKAVELQKREERAAVYVVQGTAYLVVTMGEKPTGGYGVSVTGIDMGDMRHDGLGINVRIEYQSPKPGQVVSQVITYPYAIVKTDLKNISEDTAFRFIVDDMVKTVYPTRL